MWTRRLRTAVEDLRRHVVELGVELFQEILHLISKIPEETGVNVQEIDEAGPMRGRERTDMRGHAVHKQSVRGGLIYQRDQRRHWFVCQQSMHLRRG